MKKRTTLAISLLLLFIASMQLFAQEQKQRPTREQIKEKMQTYQWNNVSKALALDDATQAKFEPIYKKYQAEMSELIRCCRHDNHPDRQEEANKGPEMKPTRPEIKTLTDEQADKIITDRLDGALKMAELHKKYYAEFKKVLSSKQILKVYETEREMRDRVGDHFKHRSQRGDSKSRPQQAPARK